MNFDAIIFLIIFVAFVLFVMVGVEAAYGYLCDYWRYWRGVVSGNIGSHPVAVFDREERCSNQCRQAHCEGASR